MLTDGLFGNALYEQITRYVRHTDSPIYNMQDNYRGVFSSSVVTSIIQTNKNYGTYR